MAAPVAHVALHAGYAPTLGLGKVVGRLRPEQRCKRNLLFLDGLCHAACGGGARTASPAAAEGAASAAEAHLLRLRLLQEARGSFPRGSPLAGFESAGACAEAGRGITRHLASAHPRYGVSRAMRGVAFGLQLGLWWFEPSEQHDARQPPGWLSSDIPGCVRAQDRHRRAVEETGACAPL